MGFAHQRKLRNLLLQPILQIKFGVLTILVTALFVGIVGFVVVSGFERIFQFVLDLTDRRQLVMAEISLQARSMVLWLSLITVLYMAIIVLISVIYTHRLVGPTVAFKRHIQALRNGHYASRVVLRRGDAFIEVANELNQLAEELAQQSKA